MSLPLLLALSLWLGGTWFAMFLIAARRGDFHDPVGDILRTWLEPAPSTPAPPGDLRPTA